MFASHPVHRHRIVTRIAKMRWEHLALSFICLISLTSIALGLSRSAFYPDQFWKHAFEETSKYLLILLDVRDATEPEGPSAIANAFGLLAGLAKLVLLVGLFGSVVFKFLIVPDVFQTRKKASISKLPDGRSQLVLRIYNSTMLEIVDIEFSAYLRVPSLRAKGARTVPNTSINIDEGREAWPIAIPFVPYSVHITLDTNDIEQGEDREKKTLRAIQSTSIAPQPANGAGQTFLVLIVKGKRPELGTDIVETHWFRLSGSDPDFEFGKFEEIHVVPGDVPKRYGGAPSKWIGWNRFDMLEPHMSEREERAFIFGYGSLVSKESLIRYLSNHGLQTTGVQYGRLTNFRRAWNVAMDNAQDIPGYKYYVDAQTGQRPSGFVSFLNIYRQPDSFVNGIIFEVPASALPELDRREQNYDRIDVTADFEGQVDGRIWAYIAKKDGLERFNEGVSSGTAMIDQYYRDDVERAFRMVGDQAHATFVATTDQPSIPVRNLRRIDIS
jgi:cation transport regulator ChaC